jgi:protein SCO1/2
MSIDRPVRTGPPPCPRFREAVSARADGEDPGLPDELVDAHLARCGGCRVFADAVETQHRRSRVRAAAPVPDLTERIMAALGPTPAGSRWRRPTGRAVAGLVAAVVMAGAGFAGGELLRGSGAGSAVASGGYPGATVMADGVPKPQVTLVDTAGQRYDLARATAGRVTLVYFGYTHCPDICPITMALTAAAVRELPASVARQVTVAFITTDPGRDSPRVIRAWLDNFDPRFVGLTGSPGAIHAAEEEVAMPLSYALPASTGARSPDPGDYRMVHAGYTLVYSQDGRAHLQVGDSDRAAELAATIERLVIHGFQETK